MVRIVGRRAVASLFTQARSVVAWVRGGWHVTLAYVVGFVVMLLLWAGTPRRNGRPVPATSQQGTPAAPAARPSPAPRPEAPHGGADACVGEDAVSKPKLLVTRQVFPEVIRALQAAFEVECNDADDEWTRDELLRRVAGKDALYVVASDRVDGALLDAAPGLKIVATGSVGYNHVDVAACAARGIRVSNTPDVLTEATADMAWALLMATARRVTESERWLREGHWRRWAWDQFLGQGPARRERGHRRHGPHRLGDRRALERFLVKLLYAQPQPGRQRAGARCRTRRPRHAAGPGRSRGAGAAVFGADHHTIGARELALMKPTATLVNIARGGIVDDAALAQALAAGRIAAAGLDVYENEPALNPALLALRNVVLTPHIGSATRSSRVGMAMLAARTCWPGPRRPLLTRSHRPPDAARAPDTRRTTRTANPDGRHPLHRAHKVGLKKAKAAAQKVATRWKTCST